ASANDSRHWCFFLNVGRLFCPLKERVQASFRSAKAPSITHLVTSSVQGYSVSRIAWKRFFSAFALGFCSRLPSLNSAYCLFHSARPQLYTNRRVPAARRR